MNETEHPGSGVDRSLYVYDSVTSGALRMARRHWYVVVVAALVGLVAGVVLTGSTKWSATADVRIIFESVSPGPVENPEQAVVDPNSIALRVEQSDGDIGLADEASVVIEGDSAAGSVTISALAPTEAEAVAALDSTAAFTRDLIVRELGAETQTRVAALENRSEAEAARLSAADERLAQLRAAGQEPGPTDPAVLERNSASDALAATNTELEVERSRLASLEETSVTVSSTAVEAGDTSPVMPVALAVLAAVAAFGCLLVLQAFDGRIRRRIHVERSSPSASVLGVLPKGPSEADLSLVARATERFASLNSLDGLTVIDLARGGASDRLADSLGGTQLSCEVASRSFDDARALAGADGAGMLLAVPFGSVTEDRLQAAVASFTTAGTAAVGVVLTDVPGRDLAWAAASASAS